MSCKGFPEMINCYGRNDISYESIGYISSQTATNPIPYVFEGHPKMTFSKHVGKMYVSMYIIRKPNLILLPVTDKEKKGFHSFPEQFFQVATSSNESIQCSSACVSGLRMQGNFKLTSKIKMYYYSFRANISYHTVDLQTYKFCSDVGSMYNFGNITFIYSTPDLFVFATLLVSMRKSEGFTSQCFCFLESSEKK